MPEAFIRNIRNQLSSGSIILVFLIAGTVFIVSGSFSLKENNKKPLQQEPGNISDLSERRQKRLFEAQQMLFTNPDSARIIARQNLECIEKIGGQPYEKFSYVFLIGSSYFYQSHYNEALRCYYKVFEYGLAAGDAAAVANVYHNIGLINLKINNYKDAVEFIQTAIDTYEDKEMIERKHMAINNLGRIYLEIRNFDIALKHFQTAHNHFTETGNQLGISSSSNHLALYYHSLNKPDSALHYFEKAYEMSTLLQNNYGLCVVHNALGNFYLSNNNLNDAFHHYYISDSLSTNYNYISEECFPKLGLARAFMHTGNTVLAIKQAEMALDHARQKDNYDLQSSAHNLLSYAYFAAGDLDQAYRHHKKSVDIHRHIMQETGISQIYHIELEQMKRNLEKSEMALQTQKVLLEKRTQLIIFLVLVSFAIIAIILLIYKQYLARIRQSQNEKLHQSKLAHTRETSRAAMEAELKGRKIMGMELHDGLGPLISLTKLNVASLQQNNKLDEQAQTLLQKTTQNLNEIQKEVKQISRDLAPVTLIDNGLKNALKVHVNKIKTNYSLNVILKFNNFDEALVIDAEHAIYRTVQELLNNVIKHAGANMVLIEFVQNENDLTIMIEDNGVGFDINRALAKGQGLSSTHNRIESIGGEMLVDSAHGRGTIVTIILPIQELISQQ